MGRALPATAGLIMAQTHATVFNLPPLNRISAPTGRRITDPSSSSKKFKLARGLAHLEFCDDCVLGAVLFAGNVCAYHTFHQLVVRLPVLFVPLSSPPSPTPSPSLIPLSRSNSDSCLPDLNPNSCPCPCPCPCPSPNSTPCPCTLVSPPITS